MRDVFIIGSKGVGQYGGYETFVQKLLQYSLKNANNSLPSNEVGSCASCAESNAPNVNVSSIRYHVACKANGEGHMDVDKLEGASTVENDRFTYCGAECFLITVPEWLKSAQAIYYDIAAIRYCCNEIERGKLQDPIVYILTCRIGPFVGRYVKKIHEAGGKVYLNPDGACEIMGSTGEKPVKSRLKEDSDFYPKSNTEYSRSIKYSGYLNRLFAMPVATMTMRRAFFWFKNPPNRLIAEKGLRRFRTQIRFDDPRT